LARLAHACGWLDQAPKVFDGFANEKARLQVSVLHVVKVAVNFLQDLSFPRVIWFGCGFTRDCKGARFNVTLAFFGLLACNSGNA
jgi:hypothetical protein